MTRLPPGSLVDRATNPNGAEWTLVVEMLANLIEVIDATSWRAVLPHAGKNWKPPKPLKIPRPGDEKPERKPGIPMAKFRQLIGAKHVTYIPPEGGDRHA